jgi:hypothetical protein
MESRYLSGFVKALSRTSFQSPGMAPAFRLPSDAVGFRGVIVPWRPRLRDDLSGERPD